VIRLGAAVSLLSALLLLFLVRKFAVNVRYSKTPFAQLRLHIYRTNGIHELKSAHGGIVLQNSKIAGPRISRENPWRDAISDSCNSSFVIEAAYELDERR
jgi:hypothetical protein